MIFSQCVWLCFISVVFHLSSSPTLSLFPLLNGPERLSEQRSTPSLHYAVFYSLFLSVFAPCRYSVPTYLFSRIQFLPGHIGHGEAKRRPCSAAQHGAFGVQMQVDKRAQKLCVCVCVCVCIMHEMKSVATHICIGEIESGSPQLMCCLPKMGCRSFLMGSCTVRNNTMLNAIIKRN